MFGKTLFDELEPNQKQIQIRHGSGINLSFFSYIVCKNKKTSNKVQGSVIWGMTETKIKEIINIYGFYAPNNHTKIG